jgi:hypothetical protein
MTLPASGPLSLSDIQTEFGGSNPISLNEYYAGGGLVPAGTSGTYGAVPTSGQISVQNFYGTSNYIPVYIEELFSTWLFNTDNPNNVTIPNGINLSGNGGLVWNKLRSTDASHQLYDTVRGGNNQLQSNTTNAQSSSPTLAVQFGSNGFTWLRSGGWGTNTAVSWTFREQPKFFDIVAYTGNATPRTIAHNLGSVPGCIIIKRLDASTPWFVYHRGNTSAGTPQSQELLLNTIDNTDVNTNVWDNTAPTSSVFSIGAGPSPANWNANGGTYIAYLFAHDAGGFGATGSDNIITCGSYTGNGSAPSGPTVTLGYEPQWLMIKNASGDGSWQMIDSMRGMVNGQAEQRLIANMATVEFTNEYLSPIATGFRLVSDSSEVNGNGANYVYIAVRRGPMKVPTVGTSVFLPQLHSGTGSAVDVTGTSFPVDLVIGNSRAAQSYGATGAVVDRLRGRQSQLLTSQTDAQDTTNQSIDSFALQNGVRLGGNVAYSFNYGGGSYVNWFFGRAPSFFDIVCYTGVFSPQTINHNLGVAPQMIITKKRSSTSRWPVYHIGVPSPQVNQPDLNNTGGYYANDFYPGAPTSTTFTAQYQDTGSTYVGYLFATCAGVSKVGSYTGTGALQTVNCGFTTGARFILIKRTDSTGDWFAWDSARGISSGNDPYVRLNDTNNEVSNTNYVDTTSVGFQVTAAAPAGLNASGGTYIFLAIA